MTYIQPHLKICALKLIFEWRIHLKRKIKKNSRKAKIGQTNPKASEFDGIVEM